MAVQLSWVFLTVIHLSVAFEFQSLAYPTFNPKQVNHPSVEKKDIQKAVSNLKEQRNRLEKQEQLISEHEDVITEQAKRLSKQRELLDQQMETLKAQDKQIKEQGERIDAQNKVLSDTIVSQKEEVARLSSVEEKLKRLETGGSVMKENHEELVEIANPIFQGNFTYLEEVGLSFTLIKTTVQNSKMEEYCREMTEGGRLIVLDTKPKYEAMQDYMDKETVEKKDIQKAVSNLKEQRNRLEKQEQLISEHEDVITEQAKRLSKQRELLDQQMETLKAQDKQIKEQGERIDAQNKVLSDTIVSQKEEVARLSSVEEKLKRLETGGSLMKENHEGLVEIANPILQGNFTYLEEVGLSFTLIKTTVQNSKMEEYCREMAEGGRLIVLDTKPKYEAMQDYMDKETGRLPRISD
ncbi:golgin subfamily A member 6-like protein 22 [Haliotis asinina]|uniref:golgin subfamily A member 6-like protein 22 n=1 Tax=Haliotis asinina TaxID=109174 RepID=UPI003531AE7B